MLEPVILEQLLTRLDASRAALLASLEGVTEREFGADLGGETVVQALAALASAERRATADVAGETITERVVEKPMPPQVVHALAGSRYFTRTYLGSAEATPDVAEALVEALIEREAAATARVVGRPRLAPPPVFPMVEPRGPQPGEPPRNFVR